MITLDYTVIITCDHHRNQVTGDFDDDVDKCPATIIEPEGEAYDKYDVSTYRAERIASNEGWLINGAWAWCSYHRHCAEVDEKKCNCAPEREPIKNHPNQMTLELDI